MPPSGPTLLSRTRHWPISPQADRSPLSEPQGVPDYGPGHPLAAAWQ